ncbi:flagellar protein FlgN [Neptuniibacter halophilus]|uniref:flagellar protein FlgN n=1 Tax=Neptuniibacter halophilus TaxID=651666 RepID=UPI002572F173|nr:flagellar protein FlgN [Neptuniibacter halophilus]
MTEQQYSELDTLLKQGILLLDSLSEIYDQELEALSSKDLDRLSDTTQEKMGLLNSFHTFTQQRVELLSSFGVQVEVGDYSLPDTSSPAARLTGELHTEIKQKLKQLQQKNKRNEQAIYRNQQNVNQLLAIVRGHKKQDQLYNKSGNSGLYKAQSRLGKA